MKEKLMSFSDFENLYESWGMVTEAEIEVPKASSPELQVVEPGTSIPKEAKNPVADLLSIFAEVDVKQEGNKKEEEVNEDDEDPTDNKAVEPEKKSSAPAKDGKVAKPVKVKVKQTPLVKALSLKNMKIGENSPRVSEVQKVLGLTQTGKFDKTLYNAVKEFQGKYGLLVDGIVGVQTYGALLQVKKGITDMEEIQKMIESLGKLTPFIVLDPRFYGVAKSCTIVTVNNITYVIVIPSDNAKEGVDQMKKDGVLTSGYEWIGKLAEGVGKALVYTTAGLVLLPFAVATALVQAAVSVVKFAAQGVYSVCSDVLTGMKQLGKWATTSIANAWTTVKKASADAAALVAGWSKSVGTALKSSAEGLIALAGALAAGLAKAGAVFVIAAWTAIKGLGEVGKKAWAGIKDGATALAEAAKKGISYLGDKAKVLAQGVKSGVEQVGKAVVALGAAAVNAAGQVVKGSAKILGAGLSFAGGLIKDSGDWLTGLVQECYEETGDPLYESLLLELAL
jgi:hypothetical protein